MRTYTMMFPQRLILLQRHTSLRSRQSAFTLIELMIVVAIVAILAAIAVPAYNDYILRARLTDGTNALAAMQAQMERYYQDNRTYAAVSGTIIPPCAANQQAGTFTLSCAAPAPDATTFTVRAQGSGRTAGFTYTVAHDGTRTTQSVGAGWPAVQKNCNVWIMKRGQSC